MTYPWSFPEGQPSLFDDGPAAIDTRLACRVVEQMQRDPLLRRERICVEVQNRVVIMEGRVGSVDVLAVARLLAWAVPGVHDVNVRLYVV
ncbi:BON domain-containing protein [Micromonospora siamensis]|uniref:BON domain-containing protein n=1 Tax=Micromonospora siamensis TaxID=299152 RepID=A0A1C5I783_9ACTN|nr:BON domain-containing protein [Micromonospora siamensis]SCG53811.1 BON domain-containing protein [Micromonospora siamensis]